MPASAASRVRGGLPASLRKQAPLLSPRRQAALYRPVAAPRVRDRLAQLPRTKLSAPPAQLLIRPLCVAASSPLRWRVGALCCFQPLTLRCWLLWVWHPAHPSHPLSTGSSLVRTCLLLGRGLVVKPPGPSSQIPRSPLRLHAVRTPGPLSPRCLPVSEWACRGSRPWSILVDPPRAVGLPAL